MGFYDWSGDIVTQARDLMARRLPAPCALCGVMVETKSQMRVGHIKSRAAYPNLTRVKSNWQIECRSCSDSGGQRAVQEKAKVEILRKLGIDPSTFSKNGVFTQSPEASKSPPLSTPPLVSTNFPTSAASGQDEAISVPARLTWDVDALAEYVWLLPLLDVPADAAPPLAMTRPHPDAVDSYGWRAIAWIERTQQLSLRWWQKLAIVRQLEHDAEGRLVWRVIVESGSRRIGKSVRLRGVALWRLAFGQELFGEPQLVMHTGKDVSIVREIQRVAWRWAEDDAGWKVSRGRGSEALETPGGDRWLARAMHAVYGYDVGVGMVDEGWGVDPGAVDEGMEPATMERPSPQLHLTSTAHRRATSLMRTRISDALATEDGETLLMLWAAPPGADPGSPATWKAASAYWSEARHKMIAAKYAKAAAGEADPEADDPDPMAGFTAQYLNVWQLSERARTVGDPVIDASSWSSLSLPAGDLAAPSVGVCEGWPGESLSVAFAAVSEGVAQLAVHDVPDTDTAAALVSLAGLRRVTVGASMVDDPAWREHKLAATKTSGTVAHAVADLKGLLRDGVVRHDGGEHLTAQVLAMRTSPSADGLRVRSTGRADGIKAAVWAAQEARKASGRKIRRLIVV